MTELSDIIRNIFPQNRDILIFFQGVYMFWRHVQYHNANERTETTINNELKNLRIKYLLNDITKINGRNQFNRMKRN